jgi:hypothetical protein
VSRPTGSRPTFVPRTAFIEAFRTKVGAALAALLLLSLGGCRSSGPEVEPAVTGSSLEAAAGPGRPLTLPPGQEVVVLVRALRNTSDRELEITKLRAVPGDGVPDAAQVVQVSVLTRSPRIARGTYVTFPPVTRGRAGRCERAGILSPSGVVVAPGAAPMLLVWLRSVDEGTATVDGLRVSYGQADTLYEQEVEIEGLAEITVDANAPARKPSLEEQACSHRTRILPGAVVF